MKIFFKTTFIFLVIYFSQICYSQSKDDYSFKIDSLIKTTNPRVFNGVILISQNQKIKYSKAFGFANFDKKTPLKLDNQFEIMSNSKQITAVLLLKEVDKRKVNLQSSIKKYLPYLTQSWADTVTVHQLLNHTHGIVDLEKPLAFKPGSDFKYGNLSNILLGKIIEFSSKKSFSEMATALFNQLKMNNTYCYSKDKTQQLVSGHTNKNNTFKVFEGTQINAESIPADGIVSTVKDLAIWNNNLHKGKILKPENYKLMTTYNIMAQHYVFGSEKVGYGYGIRISEKTVPKYFGHTGLGDGFAAANLYFPESDVSLTILENQVNDNFDINYFFENEIRKIVMKSNLVH